MYILTIRTDKPEAELGLYEGSTQLAYMTWEAHRALAATLHQRIAQLLNDHDMDITDLGGMVVFKGPGSFTGLRIGIATANALAYSLAVPIVAETDDWIERGIARLLAGVSGRTALPEYGAPAFTTVAKK